MRYVYLDFESYYEAKTYTLKTMSMEAYIRDLRFDTQLLGVAIDDSPVHMFPAWLVPQVLDALQLDDPNTWTFAQNAKFDIFIIQDRYGKYVSNPICSRAMARWTGVSRLTRESQAALCEFLGTGKKGTFIENMSGKRCTDLTPNELIDYKQYCTSDVSDLRSNVLAMLPHMTWDAMEFISMTTKMYTNPRFVLDKELLEDYYAKLTRMHAESQAKLQHLFRFESQEAFLKALRSKKKFCELLESIGGTVPYKKSEKKSETERKKIEAEIAHLQGLVAYYADDPIEQEHLHESLLLLQQRLEDEEYIVFEPALAKKDLGFMALMDDENPDIAALVTARAENNSSIAMSRTITFLEIARRGLLPVPLEPFLAWTGRYTGGSAIEDVKSDGVNLQNLAKRSGDKTLRHAVTAPPGHVIVAGDSSQIEARVLAWLAGQSDLVHDFATGGDPYSTFGGSAYNEDPLTVFYWAKGDGNKSDDPEHKPIIKKYEGIRFIGKTGILQLGYGSGGAKLALFLSQNKVRLVFTAACDMEYTDDDGKTVKTVLAGQEIKGMVGHKLECDRIVTAYRSKYAFIPQFWRLCDNIIRQLYLGGEGYFGGPNGNTFYYTSNHNVFGRKMPGIMFPDGYWLRYPNLRQEFDPDKGRDVWVYDQMAKGRIIRKQIYGGLLTNNLCQGFAFSIMRYQALNINRVIPVVMNVHDEWTSIVPEVAEQAAKAFYIQEMRRVPEWAAGVPLDCEVHSGRTYGQI